VQFDNNLDIRNTTICYFHIRITSFKSNDRCYNFSFYVFKNLIKHAGYRKTILDRINAFHRAISNICQYTGCNGKITKGSAIIPWDDDEGFEQMFV
jgi:hypothetical protein